MDEIDNAQEKLEIGLADAIRRARLGGPVAVATGRCLYCDEIVPDEHRWCQDSGCRDAWCKERGIK